MKEIHMPLKKTIRPLKFFIGDALIYSFWKSKKCKRESGKKNSEFKIYLISSLFLVIFLYK